MQLENTSVVDIPKNCVFFWSTLVLGKFWKAKRVARSTAGGQCPWQRQQSDWLHFHGMHLRLHVFQTRCAVMSTPTTRPLCSRGKRPKNKHTHTHSHTHRKTDTHLDPVTGYKTHARTARLARRRVQPFPAQWPRPPSTFTALYRDFLDSNRLLWHLTRLYRPTCPRPSFHSFSKILLDLTWYCWVSLSFTRFH